MLKAKRGQRLEVFILGCLLTVLSSNAVIANPQLIKLKEAKLIHSMDTENYGAKAEAQHIQEVLDNTIEVMRNKQKAELQIRLEEEEKRKAQIEAETGVDYIVFDPSNLKILSNANPDYFKEVLKKNGRHIMSQYSKQFIAMEKKYGVNAWFLATTGVLESTDFSSSQARQKYNPFGIGAWDSNPNNANTYKSFDEAIESLAHLIAVRGPYYKNGDFDVWSISKTYCSNPNRANDIINQIEYWKGL